MVNKITGAASASSEPTTIGPDAVAILEFTSDSDWKDHTGKINYVTSKSAYIWAGLSTIIARYTTQQSYNRIEDVTLHAAIYAAVAEQSSLSERTITDQPPIFQVSQTSAESDIIPTRRYTSHDNDADIASALILSILDNLGIITSQKYEQNPTPRKTTRPSQSVPLGISKEINSSVSVGYKELRENHFIVDPVIETTIGLAIMSLIPFKYVKKTKRGQIAYRKIQAGAWKYEWSRKAGGHVQTQLTFEVARIAKALKIGVVAAYHEAAKGEGDEPEGDQTETEV
jgi:hypothetical protein